MYSALSPKKTADISRREILSAAELLLSESSDKRKAPARFSGNRQFSGLQRDLLSQGFSKELSLREHFGEISRCTRKRGGTGAERVFGFSLNDINNR